MRERIALAVALLMVIGVAVGGYFVLFRERGVDRQEQAERAVQRYLTAWHREDYEVMEELTLEPPRGFERVHRRILRGLAPYRLDFQADEVVVVRGQADTDVRVVVRMPGVGVLRYRTHLTLLRADADWKVQWSHTLVHPDLRDGWRFERQLTGVERAPILAHDGTPLTEAQEVTIVGIEPQRIQDRADVAEALIQHTDADPEEVRELLARTDLVPDWFYPVVTLREEEFDLVQFALRPVPGIVFQTAAARLPPEEGFAQHVLGRTGEITAELLEELGPAYEVGDIVGLSGLERVYEESLTGRPGAEVVLVDADGDIRQIVANLGGREPEPLRTTLDVDVQQAAETALARIRQPAALVAVDARTGAIRASVSRPLDEFDRALGGLYPPGSTFKVVTAAALLEDLEPTSTLSCPREVSVGGLTFRNAHDLELGDIPLRTAFAQSCNTAFAQAAAQLDARELEAVARTFGFGADYELPVAAATTSFPDTADLAERAAAAIGQARVQASPAHMASVAATVAGGGWRPPHLLVDDARNEARQLDPEVATTLAELMRAVVTEGTGTAAEVPGEPVHGKTGSAEFGVPGPDGELPTHAWFIGFRGDLAFAVMVEGGGGGGDVAAPLAARFLRALDAAP